MYKKPDVTARKSVVQPSTSLFPGAAVWHKCWSLLTKREQRLSLLVLGVMSLAAISSTVMVASVLPFLSVLSNPNIIQTNEKINLIYEYAAFSSPYRFIVAVGLVTVSAIVMATMLQLLNLYIISRFAMMRMHSLSSRMLEIYLGQPYDFHLTQHSGNLSKSVLNEAQVVVNQFFLPASEFISSAILIVLLLAFLFFIQPLVTIAAFVMFGGAYCTVYLLTSNYLQRIGQERLVANRERFIVVNEALGGFKDMKVLGREAVFLTQFIKPSIAIARSLLAMHLVSKMPSLLFKAATLVGIIALGLLMVNQRVFETGNGLIDIIPILGTFALAAQRLLPELNKVFSAVAKMKYSAPVVESVHANFKRRARVKLQKDIPSPLQLQRQLSLEAINYWYPGSSRPEVADITLSINAGERIGIVGNSGSGKSTLADVILGLLSPQNGRIIVDEMELSEADMRSWQQTIGYVPQNIFLMDASVGENIALGLSLGEIDHERVRRAARKAQIDAFIISELPDGYATNVGERGFRLSGGQIQRIGIARALYHDPELIIFDEATSALDTVTEREVMNAINTHCSQKTVILISHRISTLKCCDRILVMEAGRMVGFDSWSKLEKANTTFQSLLLA